MIRRALRRAAVVTAGLGVSACSLLVDTSGLIGGASDGGSLTDGGSPPLDGSGATDAPAADGRSGDSGPLDGGADGADPCSGKAICEDFEGTEPKGDWDLVAENGGLLRLDSVRPRAGKQSLHATRSAGNASAQAFLRTNLGAKFDIDCELDAWMQNLGTTDSVEIATVIHRAAGLSTYESAYVFVNAAQIGVGEFVVYTDGGTALKQQEEIALGSTDARWLHVTLHVSPTRVDLAVDDGTTPRTATMTITPPLRTDTTLQIGAPYGNGTRQVDVFVDNLRCAVK